MLLELSKNGSISVENSAPLHSLKSDCEERTLDSETENKMSSQSAYNGSSRVIARQNI